MVKNNADCREIVNLKRIQTFINLFLFTLGSCYGQFTAVNSMTS